MWEIRGLRHDFWTPLWRAPTRYARSCSLTAHASEGSADLPGFSRWGLRNEEIQCMRHFPLYICIEKPGNLPGFARWKVRNEEIQYMRHRPIHMYRKTYEFTRIFKVMAEKPGNAMYEYPHTYVLKNQVIYLDFRGQEMRRYNVWGIPLYICIEKPGNLLAFSRWRPKN